MAGGGQELAHHVERIAMVAHGFFHQGNRIRQIPSPNLIERFEEIEFSQIKKVVSDHRVVDFLLGVAPKAM